MLSLVSKVLSFSTSGLVLLCLSQTVSAELVSEQGNVVVYRTADDFETVKENVEMAITNRGLLVSGTLHVSDMLNRTSKDLGFSRQVYQKAESLEFCSAMMSHRMTQVSPNNLSICPFTVSVYVKTEEADTVYVTFRRQHLDGDAQTVTDAIHEMLHGIVKEALDE